MFTGIIDHCGTIQSIEVFPNALRLSIQTNYQDLIPGESIAIDGICLTVTEPKQNSFVCDLSKETLEKTTAKQFQIGTQVNLERALLPTSRLGGHFVTGHVDQVATVSARATLENFLELTLSGLSSKFLIQKGSLAVNGVSLTINTVKENSVNLTLIPHTLSLTNLSQLKIGDEVNIEFDMIAKLVVEQANKYRSTYAID